MRFPVVILLASSVIFGAARAHADDGIVLPPLATFGDQKSGTYTLDMKGDKPRSTVDIQSGFPPVKKEEVLPFVGLSITRPLDFKK